jgi:VanZ family protein
MTKVDYQIKYWLPVYFYAFAIFLSSAQSRLEMPINVIGIDKVFHFIAYAILGILIYRACDRSQKTLISRKAYFWSAIASVLYGFSDEFHQFFVPGRQTSEWDFVADSLGAIVAIIIIHKLTARKRRASAPAAIYTPI